MSQANKSKSPSSKKKPAKPSASPVSRISSALVWSSGGILMGLAIAFIVGLVWFIPKLDPIPKPLPNNTAQYDYPEILKKKEPLPATTPRSQPTQPKQKIANKPKKTPPKPTASTNARYTLQIASFRSAKDAESMRAQLILEGLTPYTAQYTDQKKQKWHRVLIGPIKSESLTKTRQKLTQLGHPPLVKKLEDK